MKAYILAALILLTVSPAVVCGENGSTEKSAEAQNTQFEQSQIYSEEDIESAIQVISDYFDKEFEGCTLTELYYPGDSYADEFNEFAEIYGADEAIILMSSFEVGPSGGDGSLNPNSAYNDWNWILVRNNGGKWEHVDHGY